MILHLFSLLSSYQIRVSFSGSYSSSNFKSLSYKVGSCSGTPSQYSSQTCYVDSYEYYVTWTCTPGDALSCKTSVTKQYSGSQTFPIDDDSLLELFSCKEISYSITIQTASTFSSQYFLYYKPSYSSTTQSLPVLGVVLKRPTSFTVTIYVSTDNCVDKTEVFTKEATKAGNSITIQNSNIPNKCRVYYLQIYNKFSDPSYKLYYTQTSYAIFTDYVELTEEKLFPTSDSSKSETFYYKTSLCTEYVKIGTYSYSESIIVQTFTDSNIQKTCKKYGLTVINGLPEDYTLYYESSGYIYKITSSYSPSSSDSSFSLKIYYKSLKCTTAQSLGTVQAVQGGTSKTFSLSNIGSSCKNYYTLTVSNTISLSGYYLYYRKGTATGYTRLYGGQTTITEDSKLDIYLYIEGPKCSKTQIDKKQLSYSGSTVTISDSNIPSQCKSIYSVTIKNLLPTPYSLYCKKSTQTSSYYEKVTDSTTIKDYTSFTLNVATKTDDTTRLCNSYEIIESITAKESGVSKEYSTIPLKCQNYIVTITNSMPDGYKLFYSKDTENYIEVPLSKPAKIDETTSSHIYIYYTTPLCPEYQNIEDFASEHGQMDKSYGLEYVSSKCGQKYSINLITKFSQSLYTLWYKKSSSSDYIQITKNLTLAEINAFTIDIYVSFDDTKCNTKQHVDTLTATVEGITKEYDDSNLEKYCYDRYSIEITPKLSDHYSLIVKPDDSDSDSETLSGPWSSSKLHTFKVDVYAISSQSSNSCNSKTLIETLDASIGGTKKTYEDSDLASKCTVTSSGDDSQQGSSNSSTQNSNTGLSGGAIAAIVIVIVVVAAAAVILGICFYRKKKNSNESSTAEPIHDSL